MADTAADFICERLLEWGIDKVYGFPGDGINGLLSALRTHQDRLKFIQVRHEEMATSGPGAIHLLNGLYDAKLDHAPVVAIVGQTYARAMGGHFQQEVDLLSLFKDVAGAYVQQADEPSALRHMLDRAIRIAKAERTVTCVIVPADVQEMKAVPKQPHAGHTVHTGIGWWEPKVIPHKADLQAAADILNQGKKVAMLVGQGALHATDEVIAVADTLGAGIAKALMGKAAVPDDVPYCTNSIGLLGTKPSWDMMMGCDTLLLVGTAFPYSEFLPKEGQAKAVQIDIKARMQSIRYPVDIALTGDSKETLRELLPLLKRQEDRSWQEKIKGEVADWWRLMEDRGKPELQNGRLRPQGLFSTLDRHLPDNAILSSDSGSSANWYARHIRIRRGMKAALSGMLATMVPGVPYAIAAKFAYPDRVAVAMVGDGAMQMLGMNELLTIGKYWREWSDPRLIVLVLNNRDLNQVTWEERVLAGSPKFEGSQDIPEFDFARFAEMCGLRGIRVETVDQIEPAWEAAFSADRPVLIDAYVDPNEPPLPPHITVKQAREFAMSLAKGDPDAPEIIKESIKEKIDEFLPGR
jgi:pyruvate dehydrogenase (quinone)